MLNHDNLILLGSLLIGLGFVAVAVSLLNQGSKRDKALQRIEQYLTDRRRVQMVPGVKPEIASGSLTGRLDTISAKFSQSKAFKHFVDPEDRKLLGKAGFGTEEDLGRFVLIRIILGATGLLTGYLINLKSGYSSSAVIQVVAIAGLGFMAPKWILKMIAEGRETAFERELVAIVDVMRLLQGVGLSVDQSIEIMATQLRDLVPITARMLRRAQPQVKSGVPWNVILKKMCETYTSEEFRSFVTVLGQIEKFGGAVQEPLRQFSERLVEKERANAKEFMGKLTVKLTGIMVVTMLPALLIMTGGPGIISIMRAFARVGG